MNVIIASDIPLPVKPIEGEKCNGCGFCCSVVVCEIGREAFPGAVAPCPGMVVNHTLGRIDCILVATEIKYKTEPLIQAALGIGKGCCCSD